MIKSALGSINITNFIIYPIGRKEKKLFYSGWIIVSLESYKYVKFLPCATLALRNLEKNFETNFVLKMFGRTFKPD